VCVCVSVCVCVCVCMRVPVCVFVYVYLCVVVINVVPIITLFVGETIYRLYFVYRYRIRTMKERAVDTDIC